MVANDGSFCIHSAWQPGEGPYDFRLKDWIFDQRDRLSYEIPFRCLYSRNIENLLVAGKHISVTHVAGSATKLMGKGAQHGVAVAAAAQLCNRYNTTPRRLLVERLDELKAQISSLTSCDHDLSRSLPTRHFDSVPG